MSGFNNPDYSLNFTSCKKYILRLSDVEEHSLSRCFIMYSESEIPTTLFMSHTDQTWVVLETTTQPKTLELPVWSVAGTVWGTLENW